MPLNNPTGFPNPGQNNPGLHTYVHIQFPARWEKYPAGFFMKMGEFGRSFFSGSRACQAPRNGYTARVMVMKTSTCYEIKGVVLI